MQVWSHDQVSRYDKWKVIVKGNKDQEYIFKFLYTSKLISVIQFWYILICFKISNINWIGKKYNIAPVSWQVQAGCNSTNNFVYLHTSMSAHSIHFWKWTRKYFCLIYYIWFLSLFWQHKCFIKSYSNSEFWYLCLTHSV